jgi:hypothetical protein
MTGFTKVDQRASARHNDNKNADLIEMLEQKKQSLARQAAHDQKSFSKRRS